MKKSMIICVLLLVKYCTTAQIHYQSSPASPVIIPFIGDTFQLTISNLHDHSIQVFPLWNRVGSEDALRNSESLRTWYLSHMTGITTLEKQISLIRAEAMMIKSPLFINGAIPFNTWGRSIQSTKKYSPIGMKHSLYHVRCGDFAEQAAYDLFLTGEFPTWNMFRNFSIQSIHSILEVNINNSWIIVDYDEGMPGFLEENLNSPNGFASAFDLVLDPALTTHAERYYWQEPETGTFVNLCPGKNMEYYGSVFQNDSITTGAYGNVVPEDISGTWTLCSGCTVTWQYPVTERLCDTTGYSEQIYFWLNNGYQDSILYFVMDVMNMSQDEATVFLQSGNNVPYDGEHFYPYVTNRMPYLTVTVPAQSTAVRIGEDLILPFFIRKVFCNGSIILGDTTIVGNAEFPLYDTLNANFSGPIVTNNMVHYLNDGLIPAGTNAIFTVYFNPRYYTLWEGINFEVIGTDTLSFNTLYTSDNIVTNVVIYTPVNRQTLFHVHEYLGQTKLFVWDMTGRIIGATQYAPAIPDVYICGDGENVWKITVIE